MPLNKCHLIINFKGSCHFIGKMPLQDIISEPSFVG